MAPKKARHFSLKITENQALERRSAIDATVAGDAREISN
jgi:hypothetical protein